MGAVIAVVNESNYLADDKARLMVPALQMQVTRDFAPVWGHNAQLVYVPLGGKAPDGSWELHLLDHSDQADALGYHDLTEGGLPLGKAFVKDDIDNGYEPSVTVSHELLELLADPDINDYTFVQLSRLKGRFYATEVCDPCEDDQFAYEINGVKVSDFIFPAWFGLPGASKFDFMGKITEAYQIIEGGYMGYLDVPGTLKWGQVHGEKLHDSKKTPKKGSRPERRTRLHTLLPSTPDHEHLARVAESQARTAAEKVRRPAQVTEAQHKHLKAFPECAACRGTAACQAHHIEPFNKFKDKGADPSNFITLCEAVGGFECHLKIGHGGNFKTYNPNVVADAAAFLKAKTDTKRAKIAEQAVAARLADEPATA